MPPKRPYIEAEDKAVFMQRLHDGEAIIPAAKKQKINVKTARKIKERADLVFANHEQHMLPPPTLREQLAVAPKSGRRKVLGELDINRLKTTIKSDREHRQIPHTEVAEELDMDSKGVEGRMGGFTTGFYERLGQGNDRGKPEGLRS